LVELLTGVSGPRAMEPFLKQLGAEALCMASQGRPGADIAPGILDSGESLRLGRFAFPAFAAGAVASSSDVLRFLRHLQTAFRALSGSGPISHDTAVAMLASADLGSRDFMGCEIGLGIFVIEAEDHRWMLHQGSNDGYRALFLHCFSGPDFSQDVGKGFVILCNADQSGVAFVAEVAGFLLQALEVQGVDFSKLGGHSAGIQAQTKDALPEQRVNLGYRDLLFRAFKPQLPEAILTREKSGVALDPWASFNHATRARLLRVSNQRFARAENLLSAWLPTFDPLLYGSQGKVMDSWESARHNRFGMDFVELALEKPRSLRAVSFSTQFHDGNHPEAVRLLGRRASDAAWEEFLPRALLKGHSELSIALDTPTAVYAEVRVEMFPDGGLSRLGLFSELPLEQSKEFLPQAQARPRRFTQEIPIPKKPLTLPFVRNARAAARAPKDRATPGVQEWASLAAGGRVLRASNEHYGPASQVISPFPPLHMFDGFESARSRTPGHQEELELQLGAPVLIERIVFDFKYFVNNNPRAVRILGRAGKTEEWKELCPKTDVKAFAGSQKEWNLPAGSQDPVVFLKVEVFPDGGINRIRVWGRREP
jgi:allantoicase